MRARVSGAPQTDMSQSNGAATNQGGCMQYQPEHSSTTATGLANDTSWTKLMRAAVAEDIGTA